MKTVIIIFHYVNRIIFGFESKEFIVWDFVAVVLK